MTDTIRVLHVDDDPDFADLAATILEREDETLSVETAASAGEGLDRLAGGEFGCVVSDYEMPGRNGIEFLEAVREEYPDLPVILFTGKGGEEVASEAITAGVTDYLQKRSDTSQYTVLANRITNAVDQYRSRRELEASQKRLSLFIDQSPLGVIEWDENFDIVRMNDAAEGILGYSEAEMRGDSWERIVPESDRDDVDDVVSDLLENRGGYHSTNENVRGDGERIVCEWHNRVVTDGNGDGDGDVVAIFSQFQDVTERTERERELELYETILETVPDGVYALDGESRYVAVNRALAEMTGYSRDELIGNHPSIIHDDDGLRAIEQARTELRESADPTQVQILEETHYTASGDPIPCETRYRALPSDDGFEGTAGVIRDITERKERERALERQNERLDEFASVVSHDLRNPLQVAQGRLELVSEECDSEYLDDIAHAHGRIETLADTLLTLAREGKTIGEREPIDLAEVCESCWRTVHTPGTTLVTDTDRILRADRNRLRQLLENLFQNAVEHDSTSPRSQAPGDAVEHGEDGVTITVGDLDDGTGFYIEDTGSGIPESDHEQVFERGYSTADGGLGSGLSIVDRIVDAHGWEIRVDESDDGGARFEITGVEDIRQG